MELKCEMCGKVLGEINDRQDVFNLVERHFHECDSVYNVEMETNLGSFVMSDGRLYEGVY
jgi:hypothetical protein